MRRSNRKQKKQQTRLSFQPLPTSSPAKDNYDPAVQDRLASVTYSGAKRQSSRLKGYPDVDPPSTLLTPEPSSAIKTGTHGRSKSFTLSRSAQLTRKSDPTSPLSSLPTSPSLPPRFAVKSPTPVKVDNKTEDEDEDDILLPSSKRRRLIHTEESLNTRDARSRGRLSRSLASSPLSRREKQPSVGRRSLRLKQENSTEPEDRTPNGIPQTQKDGKSAGSSSSARSISDIGSPETSGDDDRIFAPRPGKARGSARASRTGRSDDAFVVDHNQVEYISSDPDASVRKQKRPSRKADTDDFLVDDDVVEYLSSDIEPISKTRSVEQSRGRQRPKTPGRRSRREQEELEEDLLDLQDSDRETSEQKSRTRGGPVTTERDKTREHLARLKQKRAGKGVTRIIISDEEDDDSESDSYAGVDIDNIVRNSQQLDSLSDDNISANELPLIGAPDPSHEQQDLEDEDDFIVDDNQIASAGRHGRAHPDVPLEFTSFASAKPKDLFIHIIEWMVKNKTSPAFQRDDPLYELAFNRVDDQVKAQAGSRLISAAWNANFKNAILARPIMSIEALPGLDEDWIRTCDACNRTNHPARYDFKFSGQAYHKDTLEPVEDDDDEKEDRSAEEDNDDETRSRASRDAQGHILASTTTHFYLGRYCAASAEMGHKLSHWKHHLNTSVLSYLESQDVLSATSILARERLNKKKREKEAEAIVDAMNDTGVVRELWQGFQDDLEDARWGMEGYEGTGKKGGKGRSKHRVGSVRVSGGVGSGLNGSAIGEWMDGGGRFRDVATRDSDSEDG